MQNFPIFQKEYLKINNQELLHQNFGYYLEWALQYVDNIQFNSTNKKEIPLTFYPIAKNIRIPSSYMAQNILHNQSSFINNLARCSEPDFWQNHLQRGNWYPWLWARNRIPGNYTNLDGWQFYFNSFTNNHKHIATGEKSIQPPEHLKLFFTYLACIKYTFQLNDKYISLMNTYKENMHWPVESKILAVQIRRGEICTRDGSKTYREYISISSYMQKIDIMMANNNFEYIYISTDSDEEIDKIKTYNSNWKLLYLPIDRSNFFRMADNESVNSNGFSNTTDLEDSCRKNPESIPFIVDSALADIYFISICHGYISTISESEFSRCGWYLQMSNQKYLTPYIDINSIHKELNMNNKDNLLML